MNLKISVLLGPLYLDSDYLSSKNLQILSYLKLGVLLKKGPTSGFNLLVRENFTFLVFK